MNNQKKDIIALVNTLTPLPEITRKICLVTSNSNPDMNLVIKLIKSDPGLTSRILRVINSAFFSIPNQVNSIEQAVVLLGISEIRNFAICIGMLDLTKNDKIWRYLKEENFWRHSILVSFLSKTLWELLYNDGQEQNAYLAGLLSNLGICLLALHDGEAYTKALNSNNQKSLIDIEKNLFGVSAKSLCNDIIKHWHISDFIDANKKKNINDIVNISDNITKLLGFYLFEEDKVDLTALATPHLHTNDFDLFFDLIGESSYLVSQMETSLGLQFSAIKETLLPSNEASFSLTCHHDVLPIIKTILVSLRHAHVKAFIPESGTLTAAIYLTSHSSTKQYCQNLNDYLLKGNQLTDACHVNMLRKKVFELVNTAIREDSSL